MIEKRILCPERVRKIEGSFGFVEHRFLRDGFWVSLTHDELLLYLLLVMAADRAGLSYYGYKTGEGSQTSSALARGYGRA
jgi:hypothetical protein